MRRRVRCGELTWHRQECLCHVAFRATGQTRASSRTDVAQKRVSVPRCLRATGQTRASSRIDVAQTLLSVLQTLKYFSTEDVSSSISNGLRKTRCTWPGKRWVIAASGNAAVSALVMTRTAGGRSSAFTEGP